MLDPRLSIIHSAAGMRLSCEEKIVMRRSLGLALVACTAVLAGCERPTPVEPDAAPTRAFSDLHLWGSDATLFTIGTPRTVQLRLEAVDQFGQPLKGSRATIFASSAPTVATVNDQGLVTAVAAGRATITATVTIGGITRSGSMAVWVVEPLVRFPVSGTYDVDVVLSCCLMTAWGGDAVEEFRYSGVFSLPGPGNTLGAAGTFADWQLFTSAGEALGEPRSGTIRLELHSGHPYLRLLYTGDSSSVETLMQVETIVESALGDAHSPSLRGYWLENRGWLGQGTFIATRREG